MDAKQVQQAEREEATRPLREQLSIAERETAKYQRKLDRLLPLFLEEQLEKEDLMEQQAQLKREIARWEGTRGNLQAQLAEQVLTDEQVQTLEALAALVHEALAGTDEHFDLRRQFVDRLDVRAILAVEDGWKVAHVRCVISPEVMLCVLRPLAQGGGPVNLV